MFSRPEITGPAQLEGLVDGAGKESPTSATAAAPRTARPSSADHRHGAAVVGSDAELIAVALPFLDAGLAAGDLVALSCPAGIVETICAALGERASNVVNDPGISLLGARAPDALGLSRRYLERALANGSGRLRVLAGIDFGPRPADWREGQRFESVFNRLMAAEPVAALCLYDRRRLSAQVIDSAAKTHPNLVTVLGWSASTAFQDPGTYVPSLPLPREPAEDGAPVFSVDDAPSLASLRRQLAAVIAARVPDRELREDLHFAAAEIASNAFRHGVRPVSARVWTDGDQLVCAITDRGTTYSDPFSGFAPAHGPDLGRGGMGLWLARKLWDHVDVVPGAAGLTVRLSTRLR
ncbi:MAG: putative anti-sigma regulatory factor, serine/threonine protein kinase [Blastococcus sp.]|jgi:anti-sigma regulatory factor (Ser/Thr protein kinase)|nr:putative anti-sigma regulatory factor, serine/threonine protein kinase [Blastococcus sp.]